MGGRWGLDEFVGCISSRNPRKSTARCVAHPRDSDEVSESGHLSEKTDSVTRASKVGCRKRLIAIYPLATNLTGVSSMKFHRGIGVAEKTAWRMSRRVREALKRDDRALFARVAEVDEKDGAGLEKTSARLTSSARGEEPSASPSHGHERQGDEPNRREGRSTFGHARADETHRFEDGGASAPGAPT